MFFEIVVAAIVGRSLLSSKDADKPNDDDNEETGYPNGYYQ